jgi:hypothetical protein
MVQLSLGHFREIIQLFYTAMCPGSESEAKQGLKNDVCSGPQTILFLTNSILHLLVCCTNIILNRKMLKFIVNVQQNVHLPTGT